MKLQVFFCFDKELVLIFSEICYPFAIGENKTSNPHRGYQYIQKATPFKEIKTIRLNIPRSEYLKLLSLSLSQSLSTLA